MEIKLIKINNNNLYLNKNLVMIKFNNKKMMHNNIIWGLEKNKTTLSTKIQFQNKNR
jgi:hypothetical protein